MKILPPRTANPGSQPDWGDTAQLQRRLMEAAEALSDLSGDLAVARQVREFSSDRRKRVLAIGMAPLVKAGESASKAECESRSSPTYEAAMDQLAKELIAAEETIAQHEALKVIWESCRSLVASQREQLRQL